VGLLGTVIFAGLVLVAQDPHPKVALVTEKATQTEGDLSLNANPAALSEIAGFDAKNTAVATSDTATKLDEGFNIVKRFRTRTQDRGPRHIGKVLRE